MYQISWFKTEDGKVTEKEWITFDTWEEMEKHLSILPQENVMMSMVCRQDFDLPDDKFEKAAWFDNMMGLFPKNMSDSEIMATIMNIAQKYWTSKDMKVAAGLMLKASKENWIEKIGGHSKCQIH